MQYLLIYYLLFTSILSLMFDGWPQALFVELQYKSSFECRITDFLIEFFMLYTTYCEFLILAIFQQSRLIFFLFVDEELKHMKIKTSFNFQCHFEDQRLRSFWCTTIFVQFRFANHFRTLDASVSNLFQEKVAILSTSEKFVVSLYVTIVFSESLTWINYDSA